MAPPADSHSLHRVLLISHDILGAKMAGPGIRYYHLSRVLSQHCQLRLAAPHLDESTRTALQSQLPAASVIGYTRRDWSSLQEAAQWAEVIIATPDTVSDLPQLAELPAAVVIDGYDPLLVEWLAMIPTATPADWTSHWPQRMTELFRQYLVGDFFVCASERQRYWWLGQLEVAGRINPLTYKQDPSLRRLVDVVAYGLPETEPQASRPMVKGVWPGIAADDQVVLWGGGLWSWLDPLTAVQAIAQLHPSHPRLKLIFPGTIHPNPAMQTMPVKNSQIYQYAEAHGLLNTAVFFGEWVAYADWPSVLLESDIALSLHHETAETQLAYRSRMLEYIWAGLPIVATEGDATSELVKSYRLGQIVAYQDAAGVAQAILNLLHQPAEEYQGNLAAARQALSWERVAQPLIQFCRNPQRAPDRQTAVTGGVPYYAPVVAQAELVAAYEQGKFIRLMRWLHQWRRRFGQK
jgi:glycosyltransferase involved in cell wall biosynthesis